jgi:hypothetical protein
LIYVIVYRPSYSPMNRASWPQVTRSPHEGRAGSLFPAMRSLTNAADH